MDIQKRFYMAMGTYAVLAILAGTTLDGKMRLAVWIFLAGLALRTIIALKARGE
jgi:hypothetical protein